MRNTYMRDPASFQKFSGLRITQSRDLKSAPPEHLQTPLLPSEISPDSKLTHMLMLYKYFYFNYEQRKNDRAKECNTQDN